MADLDEQLDPRIHRPACRILSSKARKNPYGTGNANKKQLAAWFITATGSILLSIAVRRLMRNLGGIKRARAKKYSWSRVRWPVDYSLIAGHSSSCKR